MRLDVSVNDATLMSELQPASRLQDAIDRAIGGQGASLLDDGGQIVTINELHDEERCLVGLIGIVRGDDIGMFELCGRLHLPFKPPHGIGRFHRLR